MRKLLDAGYLEDWTFNQTLSGVPQGSICSPILSNILLDKLDKFAENTLIPRYTRGKHKKVSKEYTNLMAQSARRFKAGQKEAALKIRKRAQQLPSRDLHDRDYRRLKYLRYADDFALAFMGPKSEAEEIKQQLATFLGNELKLNLSEEKTLITNARSDAAKLLGYEIATLQSDTKQSLNKAGHKRRSINGRIGLRVPRAVLLDKCNRYKQRNKAVHRTKLLHESDYTIIATYQLEYRGIVNYYRLAYNLHTLQHLKWIMQQSLTKTLAAKHQMSVKAVYDKYQAEMVVNDRTYKVLQAVAAREGKEPLIATWGGIPLEWDIKATVDDKIYRHWNSRSELEKRLLAQVCEACGVTHMTAKIEVHHIRALKDLNKYEGREKTWWVKTMAARRRKTLVLCRTCHVDLHAGRPLKQKVSRSRTEPL
jgi:hypothetical protein